MAQVFGKQGAGAPVRSDTGEVVATYHVDGDTQMGNVFRNNFGVHATGCVSWRYVITFTYHIYAHAHHSLYVPLFFSSDDMVIKAR